MRTVRSWRTLRALVWLRYRTLLNGLRAARGRDGVERASRAAGLVLGTLAALLSLGAAIGLGWGGWLAGRLVGSGEGELAPLVLLIRIGLLGLLAILILAPLGRSVHGRDTGSSRFVLLPVSRRLLHGAQLFTALLDPWIFPVIPFLVLLPLGLATSGKTRAGLLCALAGLLLLAAIAASGSLAALAIQALLRQRGRAEIIALLFFAFLSTLGIIPSLLRTDLERHARDHRLRANATELAQTWPVVLQPLPSELYGRAVREAIEGRAGSSLAWSGGLLALGTLLYTTSLRLHDRLLSSPEASGARRRGPLRIPDTRRWPVLSDPVTAIARAQVRTTLRTLRGKFTVFFTGPLVALIGLSLRRAHMPGFWKGLVSHQGYLLLTGAAFIALNSAQPLLANLFAVDKAGLTRQFLAPVRDRDIVLGKVAGSGLLFALTLFFSLLGSALALPGGSLGAWLAAYAGGLSAFLLAIPILVFLSMAFPKPADLNKMGNPGNPHGAASFLSVFVALFACTPPILLLSLGYQVLGMPWLTLILMAGWMLATGGLAYLLSYPLAKALADRRENLILVAERR